MEKEYLTINEVAEWLGLDQQTIRRYLKEGKFKSIRLGDGKLARHRIFMPDLLEWIRKNKEGK